MRGIEIFSHHFSCSFSFLHSWTCSATLFLLKKKLNPKMCNVALTNYMHVEPSTDLAFTVGSLDHPIAEPLKLLQPGVRCSFVGSHFKRRGIFQTKQTNRRLTSWAILRGHKRPYVKKMCSGMLLQRDAALPKRDAALPNEKGLLLRGGG